VGGTEIGGTVEARLSGGAEKKKHQKNLGVIGDTLINDKKQSIEKSHSRVVLFAKNKEGSKGGAVKQKECRYRLERR